MRNGIDLRRCPLVWMGCKYGMDGIVSMINSNGWDSKYGMDGMDGIVSIVMVGIVSMVWLGL